MLEEFKWQDVRDDFNAHHPDLSRIIDDLNPSPDLTLFKCSYPFGSEILKHGLLQVPNKKGILVPLNDEQIEHSIREKLNYNRWSNPVSLIVKNSAETSMVDGAHTIPLYGSMGPGKIFGTWLVLGGSLRYTPIFLWNMTAGARSMFMLPKISENSGFDRLKNTFNLKVEKPRALMEHWEIFRELYSHKEFNEKWNLEIIYFSKKWFDSLNDKKFIHFKSYLMNIAWEGSEFWRNQFIWRLLLSLVKEELGVKPKADIDDQVRHLLSMGIGVMPGFAPSIDDKYGPISRIQEIIQSVYQLDRYAPIIMTSESLSFDNPVPIYYSSQYSTAIEFSPPSREGATKIMTLHKIKNLLHKYLSGINNNAFFTEETIFNDLPNIIQYDFFHPNREYHVDVRPSHVIPQEDPRFLMNFKNNNNNLFPAFSSFVRGCVRVMVKKI